MKYQAIALNRISSKDQESGHSLDAQLKNVEAKAAELAVDLVKVWTGVRSSRKGKNYRRQDLEEMLAYCKANKLVKYVLIDMVNRFMREMQVMFYYIVLFEELGVEIIFCDPSQQYLNSNDQMSQLLLAIEGFKAEADNKTRAETSMSRMHSRIKEGYYLSKPHQGYVKSNLAGLHIPDPIRFKPLQKTCKHIIYDGWSVNQAVKWLNETGYRTGAGRKMTVDHFIELLSDRYYCGIIDMKPEGWPKNVVGLHERMLSKREHALLLEIFKKRNPRVRLQHNPDFPLSNMLKHGDCNHKLNTETDKFTGHHKQRGYRGGKPRPLTPVYDCRGCRYCIGRDKVHSALSAYLSAIEFQPSPEKFRKALLRAWKNQRGSNMEQVKALNRKKDQLEQQLGETTAKYVNAETEILESMLSKRLETLTQDIKQIETDVYGLENTDLESDGFVAWAFDYVTDLQDKWWFLSPANRTRGAEILFNSKIYINKDAFVHSPTLSSIYTLGSNKKALSAMDNALLEELPGNAPGSARVLISRLQA